MRKHVQNGCMFAHFLFLSKFPGNHCPARLSRVMLNLKHAANSIAPLVRAYELRLALRAISSGSGVRLCLSLSLVRHEGCGQQAAAGRCGTLHADLYHMKRRDQLLPARSVRGVPLQGGGMETSGRQPCHFLHRRAEIAILKKCDVFIDKPAVFVYLHLRVGM